MANRIYGAVGVSKILDGGVDVGCQGTAEIPGVKYTTQDFKGPGIMGTLSLPTSGQVESMQLKINCRGLSSMMAKLQAPGVHDLELRLVQDTVAAGGQTEARLAKVFVTGTYVEGETGTMESGSVVEGSATYEVQRMQIIEGGEEVLLIDKLTHQHRVNGRDYGQDVWTLVE